MKNRQYTSLIDTTLFQCRCYRHWRCINVDQTMFQHCMTLEEYAGEFCLLGAFHFLSIFIYLLIEAF